MADCVRLLILAGTKEARGLAEACSALPNLETVTSLAGRTHRPIPAFGETRIGGFGGVAGLCDYLERAAIDLVIDATHPFAVRMQDNAIQACQKSHRPLLRLQRPPWRAAAGDQWHCVQDAKAAAACLRGLGQRWFLAAGHKDLAHFLQCEDLIFLVRTIEPLRLNATAQIIPLQARGPFTLEAELKLLATHKIEGIVTKNSGGSATFAKIEAARHLRLPVVMIERPGEVYNPAQIVTSLAQALAWLHRHAEQR